MSTREIKIGNLSLGARNSLVFIAGPCVIESEQQTLQSAEKLKSIAAQQGLQLVFKASYDKANRSSVSSYRGPGIEEGLRILRRVKEETGLPILSDVHTVDEAGRAAEVIDVLQIPAFLCRQTDLVLAAAQTGKPVNVKKGQFLAPADMKNVIDKIRSAGNEQIMVTERGVSFGYNNLVVDMRSIPIIQSLGYPVVYDATHSVQLPGGLGDCSGGEREFILPLCRAAVSAGCDAVFMEVHDNPDTALCDGPNMLRLDDFPGIASQLLELNELQRKWE